jgi:hypothetical protein
VLLESVAAEIPSSPLVPKLNPRLIVDDEGPREAIGAASVRNVDADGEHAGDAVLKVDHILRWLVRVSIRFHREQVAETMTNPGVPNSERGNDPRRWSDGFKLPVSV